MTQPYSVVLRLRDYMTCLVLSLYSYKIINQITNLKPDPEFRRGDAQSESRS